ncbi:MAG: PDZ domain-containing protein [Bacteroidales bacterium]|nr:PDZ domain-containing protein [Bacteroidales bacterium]
MGTKRSITYLPLILALVLSGGILLGLAISYFTGGIGPSLSGKPDKIESVIQYIENNYVDTISSSTLEEKSVTGLLEKLDPHSMYIPASEFHAVTDPLLGSFEGIGVSFRMEGDTITVINPIPGGPSEQVGVKAGDRIVKVNGENVAGKKLSTTEVMRLLKGPKGTTVDISVFRRGTPSLIEFTIIRDVIPTYSLDIAYMVSPGVGYIRLNNFSATTSDEFHMALAELIENGMNKLIIDLQGNTGGYLQAAVDVSNELLKKGDLIVYTQGTNHPKEMYYANGHGLFKLGGLVVLIDEWSASAAEIVAGAVQDNDRGLIIGRRSFGKGLVQEQLNLRDGSAVRLTVAKYYTPTGRCIQKPYESGSNGDYYADYFHRIENGELENADSIKIADSLKFTTPGGKVVYGGGGIIPDIFVPMERNESLTYYTQLINKGILYRYAFDFTDQHRKELSHFTSFADFNRQFQVTDEMYRNMIDYADRYGVKRERQDLQLSDNRARVMVKAYIGRNILDNEGFFPLLNSIDPVFLKSVEILKEN